MYLILIIIPETTRCDKKRNNSKNVFDKQSTMIRGPILLLLLLKKTKEPKNSKKNKHINFIDYGYFFFFFFFYHYLYYHPIKPLSIIHTMLETNKHVRVVVVVVVAVQSHIVSSTVTVVVADTYHISIITIIINFATHIRCFLMATITNISHITSIHTITSWTCIST